MTIVDSVLLSQMSFYFFRWVHVNFWKTSRQLKHRNCEIEMSNVIILLCATFFFSFQIHVHVTEFKCCTWLFFSLDNVNFQNVIMYCKHVNCRLVILYNVKKTMLLGYKEHVWQARRGQNEIMSLNQNKYIIITRTSTTFIK